MLIWLHLIAATVWIGGILFLSLVLVPVLRAQSQQTFAQTFFRMAAQRFKLYARMSMIVLIFTGLFLLHQRSLFSLPIADWPSILLIKLSLVALLIALSLFHEIVIGPRVKLIRKTPEAHRMPHQQRLLWISPWINRTTVLLSLGILYVAVLLAQA